MKKAIISAMMLVSVVFAGSHAENHKLATRVPGIRTVEYVKKAKSAKADSVNKVNAQKVVKDSLVKEVDKYIRKRLKNFDKDISEHIANECLANDIDICFALAQAQIETNFGTTGIGKSRKSMYGVYRSYKSKKHSTSDWIKLLKEKYLGSKKTVKKLMDNYITLNGQRYSQNPKYESILKSTYKTIKSTTNIYRLQNTCSHFYDS